MSDPADLADLLCARLCHDLVSPVGAIAAGLELMRETDGAGAEEYALIEESARAAQAALGFLRVAFGPAGADSRPFSSAELEGVARAYYAAGRWTLDWPRERPALPRPVGRLALLLLLAGGTATPLGGRLSLDYAVEPVAARLVAEGRRAGLSAEAAALISGAAAPETPREAHLALLARVADGLGLGIAVDAGEERVVLSARPARG